MIKLNPPDIEFLESFFKQYYYDHTDDIPHPTHIQRREFGYQTLGNIGMMRHIQIRDKKNMNIFFLRNTPSDVYCSNAYYRFPNMPLTEKDWQGADLIFDVDAKDLQLPCRKNHVFYVCHTCNAASTKITCDTCGENINTKPVSLPCKKCMAGAKEQIKLLVDILCDDLGISPNVITIYFSGNEGYHVHVLHGPFLKLDASARTELADYITLRGLLPESMGVSRSKFEKQYIPNIGERGWRGKFAKYVFVSKKGRNNILSEFDKLDGDSRYARFQGMVNDAINNIGIKIDSGVTMDVHRIFRMPHTINSKSSMIKMTCSDIDTFDPYVDAVIDTSDTVDVVVHDCPLRFRLRDTVLGSYKHDKKITLPKYAAAYLLCKGLAHIP